MIMMIILNSKKGQSELSVKSLFNLKKKKKLQNYRDL